MELTPWYGGTTATRATELAETTAETGESVQRVDSPGRSKVSATSPKAHGGLLFPFTASTHEVPPLKTGRTAGPGQ